LPLLAKWLEPNSTFSSSLTFLPDKMAHSFRKRKYPMVAFFLLTIG